VESTPPESSTTTTTSTTTTVPTDASSSTTSTSTTTTTLDLEAVRETGELSGQGERQLPQVDLISDTPVIGRIVRGDIILTAGGNLSLAPQNIPVGRVVNVVSRSTAEGPLLEVEPYADLGNLNFVSVVLFKSASEVTPSPDGTQAGD
jgi:cell shape-determining protein MreC